MSHLKKCELRVCVCVCVDAWKSRWEESKHKTDYGEFVLSAGKFYGDADKDKGEWIAHVNFGLGDEWMFNAHFVPVRYRYDYLTKKPNNVTVYIKNTNVLA